MLEIDRLRRKQKEGLIVIIIGIGFFIMGFIAYSITESHTIDMIGAPVTLVSRPYWAIGAFLMLLGIVEIIVGIISKIHYDNKLKIFDMQVSKQYSEGQYYQQPQSRLLDCPNCNLQIADGINFCPNCGAKING